MTNVAELERILYHSLGKPHPSTIEPTEPKARKVNVFLRISIMPICQYTSAMMYIYMSISVKGADYFRGEKKTVCFKGHDY